MRALEFVAEVDRHGRFQITLPSHAPRGPVRVLVLFPGSDDVSASRGAENESELASDLADEQEDLYAQVEVVTSD